MTYVLVLFLIGFLILIHELGHLWAAHAVGIPVKRFSIGFGPKLFGWRRRGTEYWVAWFPLGGYVMPAAESEVEFLGIDVWRRIVFSLGGPAANVLFAVAIFGSVNILQHGWSLSGAFVAPWGQTIGALNSILLALPELLRQPGELSGVVGIVAIGNKVVGAGAVETMGFMLALTLSLAVLNMLPIPPLDGGRIVINVLEKLHPRAARLHVPLAIVGWFGLIGLMMYTTYADIAKHVIG